LRRNCLTLIAVIWLALLSTAVQAGQLRVTLLQAEEGAAYREFAQAFASEVEQAHLPILLTQSSNTLVPADLIIAIGVKSALLSLHGDVPVLCVMLSKSGYEKAIKESGRNKGKNEHSAIYLDQPMGRQLALIQAALPDRTEIGALASSAAAFELQELRRLLSSGESHLHERLVHAPNELSASLQAIVGESQVLLALPDAEIYNSTTIRNILLTSYRNNVPLIGIAKSYVNAGALSAIYSTAAQIAAQAAQITVRFSDTSHLPLSQYPNDFEVMVNLQVARSLGIRMPETSVLITRIKAGGGGK